MRGLDTEGGRVFPAMAETVLRATLDEACDRSASLARFREAIAAQAAVRLQDVIDTIAWPHDPSAIWRSGWRQGEAGFWRHESGRMPDVILQPKASVAIAVERLDRALPSLGFAGPIRGAPFGPLRQAIVEGGPDVEVILVERNGGRGLQVPVVGERKLRRARLHQQTFRTRRRQFRAPENGVEHVERLVDVAVADLGADWACGLFLRAEREYWSANCASGALQQHRQEKAGVGWANIDHYAYCVSREVLPATIRTFNKLGFTSLCGLFDGDHVGGLVLEQPALRVCVVLEFDDEGASPAGQPGELAPLTWRYQAGLWAAMHGESLLDGGARYIAARCDRDALARQLAGEGLELETEYDTRYGLKQTIARAPRRAVRQRRVDDLEQGGFLLSLAAEEYRLNGARAAHFRGIERMPGFHGFAPPSLSEISAAACSEIMDLTDRPRRRRPRARQHQR